MEELKKLLESRPTLYLATVEGSLPRVRPINHYMVWNDRFYIAMGKHKEAYKQLLDNTNLELCADLGEQRLLRIQGTVNFDRSPEAYAAVYEAMPDLNESFSADTGKRLALIYLDHISAILFDRQDDAKQLVKF